MESFGRYLRAEREAREVSIEDLSRVTKINRHVLHAIESDAFDDLPAPVFVRGFVRSIARTLGLPEAEALALYEDYLKTHGPAAASGGGRGKGQPSPAPAAAGRPTRGPITFVLGVLLFALALGGAYWLRAKHPPGPPPPPPVAEEAPPDSDSEAAPAEGVPQEALAVKEAEETSEPPAPPPPPAAKPAAVAAAEKKPEGEAESRWLVLQARGECWIKMRRDAEEPREYTLREGERFSQRYGDRLILTVGDPSNLSLEVAGTQYPRLGKAGEVITLAFPLDQKARERLAAANQEPRAAQAPEPAESTEPAEPASP